jgi:hypothetical protein
MSINQQQKAGNKMSTEKESLITLQGGGVYTAEQLGRNCQTIYIVNRDAPDDLGGAMVSMFLQINQDSYGHTQFGLLPVLLEVKSVEYHDRNFNLGTYGVTDTFVLMGNAVNIALEMTSLAGEKSPVTFLKNDCAIYVINESGTTESTMCSVYSYMAERGFPF